MMDRVNLYIYTTVKGPGVKSGSYTFLLEYDTEKGPVTLTKQGTLADVTEHQAHLRIFREAMERLKRPCEVEIHTDSRYLQMGVQEWLNDWVKAGWENRRGKPVANREEWQKIAEILERNLVSFRVGEPHPYRIWLQAETEKKEKERKACLNGSGNSMMPQG